LPCERNVWCGFARHVDHYSCCRHDVSMSEFSNGYGRRC
jgi:hypothetical protein